MDPKDFIPKSAATYAVQYDGPPRDFYFVLLNKLTMLAFSSAMEPLRIANQVTGKALYRWFTMTPDGKSVRCSNNVLITPDGPLRDITKQDRAFICAGVEPAASQDDRVTHWLRRQQAHGVTVGGICTGAFTLAQTKALRNRRFTLHWENQPAFVEYHPHLTPSPNLYEKDGDLMTCGGGSAATDMMLDVIETDHSKELALMVADMCLHARSVTKGMRQQSAQAMAIGTRNPRMIKALSLMKENLEDPIPIDALSSDVGLSRRQLERLFKRYLGESPSETYMGLRVARAYALLSETDLSITEISMATGFTHPNQLSIRFRKRYDISPHSLRKAWADR